MGRSDATYGKALHRSFTRRARCTALLSKRDEALKAHKGTTLIDTRNTAVVSIT